jgi:hypothetical protein
LEFTVTVFVLRCWLEPQLNGAGAWRASLYDPNSRERVFFSDPDALTDFFRQHSPDTLLESDFNPPPTQRSNP